MPLDIVVSLRARLLSIVNSHWLWADSFSLRYNIVNNSLCIQKNKPDCLPLCNKFKTLVFYNKSSWMPSILWSCQNTIATLTHCNTHSMGLTMSPCLPHCLKQNWINSCSSVLGMKPKAFNIINKHSPLKYIYQQPYSIPFNNIIFLLILWELHIMHPNPSPSISFQENPPPATTKKLHWMLYKRREH